MPVVDPRPLIGEPLPLDLLNTTWMSADGLQDWLADEARRARVARSARVPDAPAAPGPLRETREALRALLLDRDAVGGRQRRARARWRAARAARRRRPRAPGRRARSGGCRGPARRHSSRCSKPTAAGSAPARTTTASSGSWTRHAPERAAGARWPPAGTATRRSVTAASRSPFISYIPVISCMVVSMTALATTFATGHVGLNVADLDRSIAFYTQIFGWTVKGRGDGYAFLGDDDAPDPHALGAERGDVLHADSRACTTSRSRSTRSRTCAPWRSGCARPACGSTTTASSPTAKARPAAGSSSRTPTASGSRSSPAPTSTARASGARPDLRVLLGRCRATTQASSRSRRAPGSRTAPRRWRRPSRP